MTARRTALLSQLHSMWWNDQKQQLADKQREIWHQNSTQQHYIHRHQCVYKHITASTHH